MKETKGNLKENEDEKELDYGIRKAIQQIYHLTDMSNTQEVINYYKASAPHESVASWYLWRSLENEGRA